MRTDEFSSRPDKIKTEIDVTVAMALGRRPDFPDLLDFSQGSGNLDLQCRGIRPAAGEISALLQCGAHKWNARWSERENWGWWLSVINSASGPVPLADRSSNLTPTGEAFCLTEPPQQALWEAQGLLPTLRRTGRPPRPSCRFSGQTVSRDKRPFVRPSCSPPSRRRRYPTCMPSRLPCWVPCRTTRKHFSPPRLWRRRQMQVRNYWPERTPGYSPRR